MNSVWNAVWMPKTEFPISKTYCQSPHLPLTFSVDEMSYETNEILIRNNLKVSFFFIWRTIFIFFLLLQLKLLCELS